MSIHFYKVYTTDYYCARIYILVYAYMYSRVHVARSVRSFATQLCKKIARGHCLYMMSHTPSRRAALSDLANQSIDSVAPRPQPRTHAASVCGSRGATDAHNWLSRNDSVQVRSWSAQLRRLSLEKVAEEMAPRAVHCNACACQFEIRRPASAQLGVR